MKLLPSLIFTLILLTGCEVLKPDDPGLSEKFIKPSFGIQYFGSQNGTNYDSILVRWSTIEPKDTNGNIIYPKPVNTMINCHGERLTVISGDSSYPMFRADDCPDQEFVFKLMNLIGDSIVYRFPPSFDKNFYAQKFDFINGGGYKLHSTLYKNHGCDIFAVEISYYIKGYLGDNWMNYEYSNDLFMIPSIDSVAQIFSDSNSKVDFLTQVCSRQGINSIGEEFDVQYVYKFTF